MATPPPCEVLGVDECPQLCFSKRTKPLHPVDGMAWTVYLRYKDMISAGMWPLVKNTLPNLSKPEWVQFTDSLSVIWAMVENWQLVRRKPKEVK